MVRRGEICYADLGPVRGSEQGGIRPVVVIQNDIGNRFSPTTIVAASTSRIEGPYPLQVLISAAEGGLPKDSLVLLNQIRTLDKGRLGRREGRLGDEKMADVDAALHESLGLSY